MKWQELQQLEKLNLFDFVNKTELDMYINTIDINMFIGSYIQYTTQLYIKFLQMYDLQNRNMFEHLARLLCKYTKQKMWKRILESKRFTKKQNTYLDNGLSSYNQAKNLYVKYVESQSIEDIEKVEVLEVKKGRKVKKEEESLLETIFHPAIQTPNITDKVQSLLDYSMTEQSSMEAWLAERIGCITGSKLDALLPCGVSYNNAKSKDTALKYLMKLAREQKNQKPIEDNEDFTPYAAKRGIAREQLSRTSYEELHNVCVFEIGFFKSPVIEGLGCSLDGIVLSIDADNNIIIDHIIEVKNFIDHLKLYKILALEDFSDVYKQIQHNLLLTNAPKAVLILDTAVGDTTNIQMFNFELDYPYITEEFIPQLMWNKLQIKNIVEEIQHVKGL